MTITDPQAPPDGLAEVFDQLERQQDDASVALMWLRQRADRLAAAGLKPHLATNYGVALRVEILCMDADELAAATRIVKDDAHFGEVRKLTKDDIAGVERAFGSASIRAWALRSTVCEKIQTGTKIETTSALSCVHCGAPIILLDGTIADGDWTHVAGDVAEADAQPHCLTAQPPDLGVCQVTETPIFETRCDPILASTEAV